MKNNFYSRYAIPIVLAAVCAVPAIVYGIFGALQSSDNDVRQWLPKEGFAEARNYEWFLKHFGSEEMVVVSWPGATLDDERLDRVAAGLAPYSEAAGRANAAEILVDREGASSVQILVNSATAEPLFRSVQTGRDAVAELTAPPLRLSREDAVRRLQGSLVGPDGHTSGMVVTISEAGAANPAAALDTINRVARTHGGLDPAEVRLGGPTVDNVALDVESARARNMLTGFSVLVALLLAWRCLRSVRLVLIVFATAMLCAGMSLAMVYYTGGTMNLVLVMMPTLIYVLSISGAIHLTNYYRDAVAKGGPAGAPLRALAAGWRPCTLAACTTAVGLGALAVSEVIPVRMFGIYASLGILMSLPVLFLFLPAALTLWPLERVRGRDEAEAAPSDDSAHWSEGLTAFITQNHRGLTALALGLMAIAGYGLTRVDTTVKLHSFFSPETKIIRDYAWLEENLGPLVPIEIVIRFDEDSRMRMMDRIELVGTVQETLEGMYKVGGTMSAATLAPNEPEEAGFRSIVRRRIIEERLRENRDRFVEANYVREADGAELWRVSARIEALNSVDYGHFVEVIRERVDPLLRDAAALGRGAPTATYTGVGPLIYKAQSALMSDLIASFVTAFLLIGVVLVFMLRSIQAGLVSMVPSLFPAVVIFGALGWLDLPVGIGSMMTASLALGIAVDDTIHFLSWFRRGLRQGLSRPDAVRMAYRRCAGAMLQTTLICGLGLLVFAVSSFVPNVRFAWMMFTLLGAALVGDLVLLPAMLVGRFGRFFEPAPRPEEEVESDDSLVADWKRLWEGNGELEPIGVQPVPVRSE
jgi:uncharacterized protein